MTISLAGISAAVAFMLALGVLLGALLALAGKKLFVHEDPRIDQVDALLPQAQCGACGTAGCRAFAEALVAGRKQPAECTVSSPENILAIAALLGVAAGTHEKVVARLACAGGSNVAYTRAAYQGLPSCRAATAAGGGGKGCNWGCLGFGDCAEACDFDAIFMDETRLPIVAEGRCTACGDCVAVCPKDLFSLHPVSHRLFVACKNLEAGEAALRECEVACTACGKCAADAPSGLIVIKNNLAAIDYANNELACRTPIERCPTGAIVWLDSRLGSTRSSRGKEAKKILRGEALPLG